MASSAARIAVRETRPDDLPFVQDAESAAENAPFVSQWSGAQHLRAIKDPYSLHGILEATSDSRRVGFFLISDLRNPHRSIELKRIVVTEKGVGFGRASLRLLKAMAFDRFQAHRFWLDVRSNNDRAYHLYLSEGFVVEGVLREACCVDGRWKALTVMSILETEYAAGLRQEARGYSVRPADEADVADLPDIERRATALFNDRLADTGLTEEMLADVTSIEEFEAARQAGRLWGACRRRVRWWDLRWFSSVAVSRISTKSMSCHPTEGRGWGPRCCRRCVRGLSRPAMLRSR